MCGFGLFFWWFVLGLEGYWNLALRSIRRLLDGWSALRKLSRDLVTPPLAPGACARIREGLLQAELNGDGQVHGHGFAVERRGTIFPLFQSVHGCLVQQRGAGNNLHAGNVSVGID